MQKRPIFQYLKTAMSKHFNSIKSDVVCMLEEQLPSHLYYHNVEHTLYVLKKAIHIGKKEHVSEKNIELLKLAALYHDVGFIKTREGHEAESCIYVKEQLPEYGYSKQDIRIICETIMATKVPQNPTTHLGEILADADLEYLATKYFKPVSERLYKELKHFSPKLTKAKWDEMQMDFLEKHQYHTKYAKRYKEFRKRKHLENLKQ